MPYFCLLLESVSRSYRALFIVQPVFDCILSAFIISYPCTRASTQVFIFLPSFISVSFISIRKLGDNMPYLFRFIFEDYNPILIESFELLNPCFESFSPRLFLLSLIFEKMRYILEHLRLFQANSFRFIIRTSNTSYLTRSRPRNSHYLSVARAHSSGVK